MAPLKNRGGGGGGGGGGNQILKQGKGVCHHRFWCVLNFFLFSSFLAPAKKGTLLAMKLSALINNNKLGARLPALPSDFLIP